jgi:hypothetical protein
MVHRAVWHGCTTCFFAFALGLALSILIGLAVYVGIDCAVNEYIQAH